MVELNAERPATQVGRRLSPRENRALVAGKGLYVSDLTMSGLVSVAFVRSPMARARIASIDTSAALALDGVVDVVTAEDLEGHVAPFRLMHEAVPANIANSPHVSVDLRGCNVPVLARGEVCHVGQGIAAVVAGDRATAEDAAELVAVEFEELLAVTSPEQALALDAGRVDPTNEDNLAARLHSEFGDVPGAFEKAPHRLCIRVRSSRVAASPMETRAVLAVATSGVEAVTIWSSTQVPYLVRAAVAQHLGMREEDVRVVAPDVGGGFGAKVHVYPEEILLGFLARRLGRPVRWVEDRQEHFVATAHGRDQDHRVEVAFDDGGLILAVRDHFVQDCGVGFPFPMSSAWNVVSHLQGLLRIPAMEIDGTCVLTNKAVNVPYRGSGRPESAFARDRTLSRIAREVGIDFREALRRNMLTLRDMPYRTGTIYRDGEDVVYDGCDMEAALGKLDALLAEHVAARAAVGCAGEPSVRRGIGLGTYTEGTGVGPFEGAAVSIDESGRLVVEAGGASQGQSHHTTLAQVVADEFGVDPDEVLVRNGDTSVLRYGVGTFASRTTILAGSAVLEAARKLRDRVLAVSSEMLEIDAGDLVLEHGAVSARGAPSRRLSLREVFAAASPGPRRVVAGSDAPGLKAESYFVPPTVTWSYGVVAAAVAVDVETGFVTVEKFFVVHDCGRIVNPLVVEGQVDGALLQGLGAALFEQVVYDASGTPLTTSFMDYLLPTSVESPENAKGHIEVPSERNPLGVKGIGESGIIAAPSAVANAVETALGELLVDPAALDTIPLRPEAVLAAMGRDLTSARALPER